MIETVRKAIGFLDAKQRRAWLRLIPISVTVAAMEAVGAATVLVLIRLIDEPAGSDSSPMVAALRNAALRWDVSPILSLSAFIGVFYIVKNALRFAEVHARQSCAGETEETLSCDGR